MAAHDRNRNKNFYARLDKLKDESDPEDLLDIIERLAEFVIGPREQANEKPVQKNLPTSRNKEQI